MKNAKCSSDEKTFIVTQPGWKVKYDAPAFAPPLPLEYIHSHYQFMHSLLSLQYGVRPHLAKDKPSLGRQILGTVAGSALGLGIGLASGIALRKAFGGEEAPGFITPAMAFIGGLMGAGTGYMMTTKEERESPVYGMYWGRS